MSQKQNGAEMAWNDNNNQTPPEINEVICGDGFVDFICAEIKIEKGE